MACCCLSVCGYTCHEGCFKKTHKKCEGKNRSKPIPEYNPSVRHSTTVYLIDTNSFVELVAMFFYVSQPKVESCQFGRPLEELVPPNTIKVPPLLETCFSFLESNGELRINASL